MPRIQIVDTTLRDGEQAPGVVLSRTDRVAIAAALVDAGIPELEVGVPAMGAAAVADIAAVVGAIGGNRVVTWCRASEADIEAASWTGASAVHLSFPASPLHQAVWRTPPREVLSRVRQLVAIARRRFARVYVGAQDASRAEAGFLADMATVAAEAGAIRIRYADTVGRLAPSQVSAALAPMAQAAPGLEIEFHGHNDLGLATANALAACAAGVHAVSVTVNGLGERAGNVALEELVTALHVAFGEPELVDCRKLAGLCSLVARATQREIPLQKPIVGHAAFLHESGLHCAGQLRDNRAYEPFPPAMVGRCRPKFVLGAHTGGAAVAALLAEHGTPIAPDVARLAAARVRGLAVVRGRPLELEDLQIIIAQCAA